MICNTYFRFLPLLSILLLGVVACDNNDEDWAAGPAVKGTVSVYFSSENETAIISTPEEFATDPTFTLTLKRSDATGSLTVPIEVETNEGNFQVPNQAEFAEGVAETSLTINFGQIESFKTCALKLRVSEEYANPYAQQDGLDYYDGTVLVSQWTKIVENASFAFSSLYPVVQSPIYHLEGVNRFRIENFLGSSYDLVFRLEGAKVQADDPATWEGELYPLSNAEWDEYGYWWLLNNAGDDYATWEISGQPIAYIEFYYGTGYSTFSNANKMLKLTPYVYQDEANGGWNYITATW